MKSLTLSKTRISTLLKHGKLPDTDVTEITSLEEIPYFDNPEDEIRFWRRHTISEELLDQIPEPLEDEEE